MSPGLGNSDTGLMSMVTCEWSAGATKAPGTNEIAAWPSWVKTLPGSTAPLLATQAAERALADAGTEAREIDAILISTCTGYLCPGLTSYVSERLRLRPEVLTLDLVGQGCGAALPNLRTAEALLAAGPWRRVLSVCVEVCSAAFYFDNDPGVLISACLFGDGAGAAVLSAEPGRMTRTIEWKSADTLLSADDRDELRFERRGGMLRNILSPQVPALAGKHVQQVMNTLLTRAGVQREEIHAWILHAGGRRSKLLSAPSAC